MATRRIVMFAVVLASGGFFAAPAHACSPDLSAMAKAFAVGDWDADGIKNGVDNCPYRPNANQRNSDGDEHGDVCDPDLHFTDLVLNVSRTPKQRHVGNPLAIKVEIRNVGNEPAHGPRFLYEHPTDVSVDAISTSSGKCITFDHLLICPLETIEVGASVSISFKIRATAPGLQSHKFSVRPRNWDHTPTNNVRLRSTTVVDGR
jgi:hypothetical protein